MIPDTVFAVQLIMTYKTEGTAVYERAPPRVAGMNYNGDVKLTAYPKGRVLIYKAEVRSTTARHSGRLFRGRFGDCGIKTQLPSMQS